MYKSFIFESYDFNDSTKTLLLRYSLDSEVHFEEKYIFDFDFSPYNKTSLNKTIERLFFIAGVSYYKTYIPPEIIVKAGTINGAEAKFYSKTYEKGLGEFWYVNNLDPKTKIVFPVSGENAEEKFSHNGTGVLVAVGGGKDSLVSIELLKEIGVKDISTWSLNHKAQLEPLVERIGTNHYYVGREWDKKLNNPKDDLPESYNGHVPISAIFACTGAVVAVLTGKKDVVMSNERSSDEPTLTYQGLEINHQYSKSSEFETDFQNILKNDFSDSLRYYSLLRPLSEVQIAKQFIKTGFNKYHDVFSSCNSAFVHGSNSISWDGTCSKCAFIYLVLSTYVDEDKLNNLIGHNLLLDATLENTYNQLLGIDGEKPLECVGEIAESRWAMDKMKEKYPELNKYQYPPVEERDIFYLSSDHMPEDVRSAILPIFEQNLLQR